MNSQSANGSSKFSFHEPYPLTPSLSPTGGEGARRAGEGDSAWFMVPMRGRRTVEAAHEPQCRAGVSPAPARRGDGTTSLAEACEQGRRDACPTLKAARFKGA